MQENEMKKEVEVKNVELTNDEIQTMFYALTTTISVLGTRLATATSENEMAVCNQRIGLCSNLQLKLAKEGNLGNAN